MKLSLYPVVLAAVAVGVCNAGRKKYTAEWWPADKRETSLDITASEHMWPPVYGFRPSGRVTVIKAPWEPPLKESQSPQEIQDPVLVDYWHGSAANVAYGHVMNTFSCLKMGTAQVKEVLKAVREKANLPASAQPAADDDGSEAAAGARLSLTVNKLQLQYTIDGGVSQVEIEMAGQRTREHPRGQYWVWPAVLGVSYFVSIDANLPIAEAAALGLNTDSGAAVVAVRFWVTMTYDRDRRFNVMEYRYALVSAAAGTAATPAAAPPSSSSPSPSAAASVDQLSIMTFNVWNTNPPTWLVRDKNHRFDLYSKRMDLLGKTVTDVSPMIVAFQEVRYDEALGNAGDHFQMQHVVDRIGKEYQYVWVPAMNYYKATDMTRVEEGPAIASKYPIVSSNYLILSRNMSDTRDEHQRVCLHVAVDIPGWGVVDVFTVHLSLLEEARDKSVVELWNLVTDTEVSVGTTQILMGDLNAEPQERAMRFLGGEEAIDGVKTDFVDAWLALHPEPTPRSNATNEKDDMLTFPSDNPEKRIDFIFIRGKGAKDVKKTWLVGQEPLEGVGKATDDDGKHIGMVDANSRVWASDHRGVVTEIGSA